MAEVRVVFNVDQACDLVRKFVSGKATLASVGACLATASAAELAMVAFGTRQPISRLEGLREVFAKQGKLVP